MKNIIAKFKKWYGALPEKKKHVELISAVLTVPMMVTVIAVNMNNIRAQKDKTTAPAATTTPIQVVIDNPQNASNSPTLTTSVTPAKTNATPTPTVTPTKTECKKDIGPIEILSPLEGEIITTDKVSINISTNSDYCPVTWSYKLDDDNWSDFSSNNIYLYNLTAGKKKLQVKIKNAAGDKTVTLERNFIYKSSDAVTTTPTASPSATSTQ